MQKEWIDDSVRTWGQQRKRVTFRMDPAFVKALKQYADQQGVSQKAVLMTHALKANPQLRRLYNQIKTKG